MAISELKKKIVIDNYFKSECDVNTSIKQAFTKGFELGLKKAPIPQPKTGWIPVSERLPEEEERFLTYIVNPYYSQLSYIMTCDYINKTWCPDDETASSNVVAWMPLPEPYKAESEE